MIFVTVGTERFPFDRLIKAVDGLQKDLDGEPVFMQIGCATYVPSSEHVRILSYDDFCEKVGEARVVVSHAGVGTLLVCASFGKKPVMMARRKCFGEHVDDHQQMLSDRLLGQNRILLADSQDDLLRYLCEKNEYFLLESEPDPECLPLDLHLKNLVIEIGKNQG